MFSGNFFPQKMFSWKLLVFHCLVVTWKCFRENIFYCLVDTTITKIKSLIKMTGLKSKAPIQSNSNSKKIEWKNHWSFHIKSNLTNSLSLFYFKRERDLVVARSLREATVRFGGLRSVGELWKLFSGLFFGFWKSFSAL